MSWVAGWIDGLCHLLGITDPEAFHVAEGLVAGVVFLTLAYLIFQIPVMIIRVMLRDLVDDEP